MTETVPTTSTEAEADAPDDTNRDHSSLWAALSGVLAAGAALGVGEIMSGFSQKIPSLVVGIAEVFTAETPGGIVRWSIENIGTSQKTLLVWGITLSSLMVGAILGVLGRHNRRVVFFGFGAFGLIGGWAAARAALSADGWAWISAALAAGVGITVLLMLLKLLPFSPTTSTGVAKLTSTPDRRSFLGYAGAAAFFGLIGAGVGRTLRSAQSVEGARDRVAAELAVIDTAPVVAGTAVPEATPVPTTTSFDSITGISPVITPSDDFYLIDTAIRKPQVNPDTWTMKIKGMVDDELEFSFADLLAMEQMEETITLSCVSNEVGGSLVGNAVWTGVSLAALLDLAGVQAGASQIVGRSVDGWEAGFPTEVAFDGRPAMVAVTMNGEPLPIKHGFPARLVVPGLYGYVSATKWLEEIELTTWDAFDGYWIPRGWAKEGPIKTQSRIDVPRHGETLPPGPTAIAGVAWAPHRSIDKVEIRLDFSSEWIEARLSNELSENSWRQWVAEYDAPVGDHVVEVRATDGDGLTQTEERARPAPDGATGWHQVLFHTRV